jgi:hypothetical protein
MLLENLWIVLGFTMTLGTVLASIRPEVRRNPFWI